MLLQLQLFHCLFAKYRELRKTCFLLLSSVTLLLPLHPAHSTEPLLGCVTYPCNKLQHSRVPCCHLAI